MNKKKVISILAVMIIIVTAVAGALIYYGNNKDFAFAEKNNFAMGTVVSQKVYSPKGESLGDGAMKLINDLDNKISAKKENSFISFLNRNGALNDEEIATIISACEKMSEESGGVFDITVGDIINLWAIGEENESVAKKEEVEKLLSRCGYEKINNDGENLLLRDEFSVDLGAVGKGLACDKAIAYYKASADCEGAVVSVGGSIGCFGKHNKAGDKWKIAVRHPRNENEFLGVISLNEGFVSTSGDYEKFFIEDDVRYHHILDGNTGYPASSGVISVTVICGNGFLSDALSTTCFILGYEKSLPLLEKYDASAIFVDEEMNITTVGDVEFEKQN